MTLQIIPFAQGSRLSDTCKHDLIKAYTKMEKELSSLGESYTEEAQRVILQERLYGLKLAIVLTGHSLIVK